MQPYYAVSQLSQNGKLNSPTITAIGLGHVTVKGQGGVAQIPAHGIGKGVLWRCRQIVETRFGANALTRSWGRKS